MAVDAAEHSKRNLHGRRRGHRLRPHQRDLLAGHLSDLEIRVPAAGDEFIDCSSLFAVGTGEIWLEIGFGAGEHLVAQAAAHPECGFIGCEPYLNGVARFISDWHNRKLVNVRLFQDDARLLMAALPPASISRIFLLFPDPWPKRRHQKRRIVGHDTLPEFARILCDGGELRFATDHSEFCRWALFHILGNDAFAWRACEAADWRARPEDWPATRYEQKALSQGRRPTYLSFARHHR
jgi:tRNA (guanine-N7-)-methyltransferase